MHDPLRLARTRGCSLSRSRGAMAVPRVSTTLLRSCAPRDETKRKPTLRNELAEPPKRYTSPGDDEITRRTKKYEPSGVVVHGNKCREPGHTMSTAFPIGRNGDLARTRQELPWAGSGTVALCERPLDLRTTIARVGRLVREFIKIRQRSASIMRRQPLLATNRLTICCEKPTANNRLSISLRTAATAAIGPPQSRLSRNPPTTRLPLCPFPYWMLDVGCWTLDVGRWMLDVQRSTLRSPRVHVDFERPHSPPRE